MRNINRNLCAMTAMLTLIAVSGCANQTNSTADTAETTSAVQEKTSETTAADETDPAETDTKTETKPESAGTVAACSKADLRTEWDDDAVMLTCSGDSVTASASDGLTVEGGTVTITKGGDYVLSGKIKDGGIIVNLTDETEKAHLFLNGAEIYGSSPISALQADKVIVTIVQDTENKLTDPAAEQSAAESDDPDAAPVACLAAKCDLTINGTGKLTVQANNHNGIHTSKDLKIVSGAITVDAVNHGVRGSASVTVYDGALNITCGGDGIKSADTEKEGKGGVVIAGGAVTINAEQDGIDAATALTVADGTLDVTAGGGSVNAAAHMDDMGFGGHGGFGGAQGSPDGDAGGFRGHGGFGRNQMDQQQNDAQQEQPEPTANFNTAETTAAEEADTTVSPKGLKAGTLLTVTGGAVKINAADDGLHANGDAEISGNAVIEIEAGDDGIHADNTLTISGGTIHITESYEGMEAAEINVKDGTVRLYAKDDGFNASDGSGGGMGFNRNGSGELHLSGGYVFVNADGDGLDSNGNITMTGGTVIVCGPTNNGNGALDCGDNQNTISVTGGTLIAVGSTGMMEVPEANYLASTELNAAADTLIVVTDETGSVLAALQTPKQAQGIVVSAKGMSDGYQIYTGGTYDGTCNEDGFASGGQYTGGTLLASGNGGGNGMMHGFGGRGNQTPPENFEGRIPGGMPDDMTPPDGFAGEPPEGFSGKVPRDGMTPPDGSGRHHGSQESSQEPAA